MSLRFWVWSYCGLRPLWRSSPPRRRPSRPPGQHLHPHLRPGCAAAEAHGRHAVPAPAGSGPVVYLIAPCFEEQGGASVIDPETYLYYIQLKPSLPSQDKWEPWNDAAEKTVHEDFTRLWGTNFLENLWVQKEE